MESAVAHCTPSHRLVQVRHIDHDVVQPEIFMAGLLRRALHHRDIVVVSENPHVGHAQLPRRIHQLVRQLGLERLEVRHLTIYLVLGNGLCVVGEAVGRAKRAKGAQPFPGALDPPCIAG